MSVIIANRPSFAITYSKDELPKFKSEGRDLNILISQIIGCALRGDADSYDELIKSFDSEIDKMERKLGHDKNMAIAYCKRLQFGIENIHRLGAKYITAWQKENSGREKNRK